jgi:hypothetical protein
MKIIMAAVASAMKRPIDTPKIVCTTKGRINSSSFLLKLITANSRI